MEIEQLLQQPTASLLSPMAIVGMDAHFADCDGLDAFDRSLYDAAPVNNFHPQLSEQHEQQLMLEVAERSIADAQLAVGSNVAVMIAIKAAAQSVDCTPDCLATQWQFTGPTLTLSAKEQSIFEALQTAQQLLSYRTVEAVVLGAVDFAHSDGTSAKDQRLGAGAVVLKRLETAKVDQDRIYAIIDAVSIQPEFAVQLACQNAHNIAGIVPADIDFLEMCSSTPAADTNELQELIQAYQVPRANLSCALGTVTANIGCTGIAAGVASLIKTALCLYHRYIPALPNWSGPQQIESWKQAPFYVAQESRSWAARQLPQKRTAAINYLSRSGMAAHIILSEAVEQLVRPNRYLTQRPLCLLAIATDSLADLQTKLIALQADLDSEIPLAALALKTFQHYQQQSELPYALTLVGKTSRSLQQDIQCALDSLPELFSTGRAWKMPSGSYFTAAPQGQKDGQKNGQKGKVAFVYPGAFNAYVGQEKDHFRLFPQLHCEPTVINMGELAAKIDRYLYPRSLKPLSRRQLEKFDNKLMTTPIVMLECDMACAVLTTAFLQNEFKIRPDIAFGYSLGETNMMIAQGVFNLDEFGEGHQLFHQSPLFSDRLSGPRNAVREHWGWPTLTADNGEDLWSIHLVMAPAERVKQVIKGKERVYLTQINTPCEVVIAGEPAACEAVIQQLDCAAFRAPFSHVIHCPPMASERATLERLHSFSIPEASPVSFYMSATYQTVALEKEIISKNIAQGVCQTLDFPRLVNQVYEDGARIFIEVGAGGSCSRYIDEILKQRPHLTTVLNLRGMDDHTAMVRALAQLVSHRIAVDISPLYDLAPEKASKKLGENQTLVNVKAGGLDTPMQQSNDLFNQAHLTFLHSRQAALQQLQQMVALQLSLAETIAEPALEQSSVEKPLSSPPQPYTPVGEPAL